MNFSGISRQTLVGRALRLPLGLIPATARVPVLQGALRGKRWIVGSSSHGCWLGSYEYAKQRAFAAAIQSGDSVYDLGANVGFYTLLASVLVGATGRVASFEPLPRNIALLNKHLALNRVANCSVWEAAVGRSDGMAAFDAGTDYFTGHLGNSGSSGAISVRTVALDSLVRTRQLAPPDVIKCDIEGGEYNALLGAAGVLEEHHPSIFLATHGPAVHQQCCGLLTGLRYRLTPLDQLPLEQSSEILATPGL